VVIVVGVEVMVVFVVVSAEEFENAQVEYGGTDFQHRGEQPSPLRVQIHWLDWKELPISIPILQCILSFSSLSELPILGSSAFFVFYRYYEALPVLSPVLHFSFSFGSCRRARMSHQNRMERQAFGGETESLSFAEHLGLS